MDQKHKSFSDIDLLIFPAYLVELKGIKEQDAKGEIITEVRNGKGYKIFKGKNLEVYINNGSSSIIACLYKRLPSNLFNKTLVKQYVLEEYEQNSYVLHRQNNTDPIRPLKQYPSFRADWKENHPDIVAKFENVANGITK